jgi:hypothetical protein
MAAMASALIEPLGDAVDRRMVALRRRTDAVDEEPSEADVVVRPLVVGELVVEAVATDAPARVVDSWPSVTPGEADTPELVGSDDGDRTTGATGKSAKVVDIRATRDGVESDRRRDPRAPTALARRRSNGAVRDERLGDANDVGRPAATPAVAVSWVAVTFEVEPDVER